MGRSASLPRGAIPPRGEAVTFDYGVLAYSDTGFYLLMERPHGYARARTTR